MVIGVTHDPDGRVIQRLSVSTKGSIGLPPNGDRNHPTKLDHFAFLRKTRTANKVEWEIDLDLTQHHGEQCRDLHIILIDDDVRKLIANLTENARLFAETRKLLGFGGKVYEIVEDEPVNRAAKHRLGQSAPPQSRRVLASAMKRLAIIPKDLTVERCWLTMTR